jgi:hypothetical protein
METDKQLRSWQKGWPTAVNKRMPVYTLRPPPCPAIMERANPSLVTQGWVGDHWHQSIRDCRQARHCSRMARKAAEPTLHTASGVWGSAPHHEGSFPDIHLEWCQLKIGVFVANIINEFVLGLDILHTYDASVNLGRQMLHLGEKEVSLWSPQPGSGQ